MAMEPPTSQPPPIPRHHRHQSRQRALQNHHHAPPTTPANASISHRPETRARQGSIPASPEVISSLITSLSVISKPASNHFEGPGGLSAPASPGFATGSFGVDYGAYSNPTPDDDRAGSVSLDDLAASSPVIRTSKPPSGFSPLTAPKSSPSRESSGGGGLKSILRGSSRPSSKGSLGSRDDTQSIGNLSIERGSTPQPGELRKQRSFDSWGKKLGRGQKGLMYISSKERLRDTSTDRKRSSLGAIGSDGALASPSSARADLFLGDTPITEEQTMPESPRRAQSERAATSMDLPLPSPRAIPTRDSSLRKTGAASTSSKRNSARNSRSKREDDPSFAIPEQDEPSSLSQQQSARRKHHPSPPQPKSSEPTLNSSNPNGSFLESSALPATRAYYSTDNSTAAAAATVADDPEEEPAPFPSVAQNRRRDTSFDRGRRRSLQMSSPDPGTDGGTRVKRSSSRLKRNSGTLGPIRNEKPEAATAATAAARSRVSSPDPRASVAPSGYERPPSADSIDDAVESYLCSPRLSQKIKHPQTGRVISFSEVGDSEGYAVICCVGMGLTRYITAFYDELALTLKLRLITPDRPGIGDSEPYPDGSATPLSWPGEFWSLPPLNPSLFSSTLRDAPKPIANFGKFSQTTCTRYARPSRSTNSPSSRTRPARSTP